MNLTEQTKRAGDGVKEVPPKQPANRLLVVGAIIFLALAGLVLFKVAGPTPSYKFLHTSLPESLWPEGKDKWGIYEFEASESNQYLVSNARNELIPLGFKENSSKTPWVRFLKGNMEIAVGYDFENGYFQYDTSDTSAFVFSGPMTRSMTSHSAPVRHTKWAYILVKNGKGTEISIRDFEIRKKIRKWFVDHRLTK